MKRYRITVTCYGRHSTWGCSYVDSVELDALDAKDAFHKAKRHFGSCSIDHITELVPVKEWKEKYG